MRGVRWLLLIAMLVLMGTAGLDVERLASLLSQNRIESTLVDGDASLDHCVLRLVSVRRPNVVAFLEYENQGVEPRLAGLVFRDDKFLPRTDDYPLEWERTLELDGARENDPEEIAQWIRREYLDSAI